MMQEDGQQPADWEGQTAHRRIQERHSPVGQRLHKLPVQYCTVITMHIPSTVPNPPVRFDDTAYLASVQPSCTPLHSVVWLLCILSTGETLQVLLLVDCPALAE